MRIHIPSLAVVGLFLALATGQAQAQHRDTVSRILVGRTETAQVAIDFESSPALRGADLQVGDNPDSTGGVAAIFLNTTLPVRLGKSLIPAGRFRLWIAMDSGAPILIVTRAPHQSAASYSATDEVGRAPLTVSRSAGRNPGLQIVFSSERHGPDTLAVSTWKANGVVHESMDIHSGTSTTLIIATGYLVMSVEITAR